MGLTALKNEFVSPQNLPKKNGDMPGAECHRKIHSLLPVPSLLTKHVTGNCYEPWDVTALFSGE